MVVVLKNDFGIRRDAVSMATKDEAEPRKGPKTQTIVVIVILVLSIAVSALALVMISNTSQVPSSDFVTLPKTPFSTTGSSVAFVNTTAIGREGMAVGVKGYLRTESGSPVAGATVYVTYYLQGEYRTQSTTTDQNGYFQFNFPMNWTGWLTLTMTYFGDGQHQGLQQDVYVSGENL